MKRTIFSHNNNRYNIDLIKPNKKLSKQNMYVNLNKLKFKASYFSIKWRIDHIFILTKQS